MAYTSGLLKEHVTIEVIKGNKVRMTAEQGMMSSRTAAPPPRKAKKNLKSAQNSA